MFFNHYFNYYYYYYYYLKDKNISLLLQAGLNTEFKFSKRLLERIKNLVRVPLCIPILQSKFVLKTKRCIKKPTKT